MPKGCMPTRFPCAYGFRKPMDLLTIFGLLAVILMLVCYVMEEHSHWWTLAFAFSCALGSAYGFLQGAWPFGAVEIVWVIVALRRWRRIYRAEQLNLFKP